MKKFLFISAYLLFLFGYGQSSVLSTGQWFKIGVTESGIYKLDINTMQALGVPISSVDPDNLKIYGNGVHGKLPQLNSTERPQDLLENAIQLSGDEDGSFDAGDFLLFYGIGPNKEKWTADGFGYEKNIYSDTSYYYLRIDGAQGKRIQSKESASGEATLTINTFQDHITYEVDVRNLIASGRGWYGETIVDGDRSNFTHVLNGISSDIELKVDLVSQSTENNSFAITANENNIGTVEIGKINLASVDQYGIKARSVQETFVIPSADELDLSFSFNGNISNGRGFIDYYTLTFDRSLEIANNETDFRAIAAINNVAQYEIGNISSSATVWNTSDPSNVKSQQFSISDEKAIYRSESEELEEFVVFSGNEFPTPFVFGSVSNQNLRSVKNLDGIIVTAPVFLAQANQLAQFHREHDGLNVKVATTREIYNEFSSGRQDVSAIRDYARFVYENGARLKYLTLFGDCSYDYKDRVTNNTNFVPTYESRDSFHPIYSHSSDDYFGFFEEHEGDWIETRSGDHTMEIGVGRLPVKTIEEAQVIVDKIIYYSTNPATLGKWRNEIAYLADDGDSNIHARHVEDLSELIDTTYAQYNIKKMLLDAFEQEEGASSDSSPATANALKTQIKNGAFTVNFIGHGSEEQWTQEQVLTIETIESLTNKNKLPIFVTATCEFGRYDDPSQFSGSEQLLLSSRGGAIALLTTSRPVFASTNFDLNVAFHEFMYQKKEGEYQRLGDIIRETKNNGLAGPVNRNFTLLGDPMMMPAFPELDIVVHELETEVDTLSALEKVTFSGEIQSNSTLVSSFNGKMVAAFYDVEQDFKTKGQGAENTPYTYSLRSNAIFRGEVQVKNGAFEFSFVVPKNISYQFGNGKMSLYAWDTERNIDASGSSREFLLGGTDVDPIVDTTPPKVVAYLNDISFSNGNTVGQSSILIADVEDENGITTSSNGVVNGITLSLNGSTFSLNEFYTASPNSYQKGTIVYPIQDLAPGSYVATLKIWDTSNNPTETIIRFEVSSKPEIFLFNEKTYPNPPVNGLTNFTFEHDREEEDLAIKLMIYNSQGAVVFDESKTFENSNRRIEIPWETKSSGGRSLDLGIYYYRLIIQSELDGAMKEISQKLVITD
ncbi:MAG: type IX secretion system sortase PorU [Ekhidna sp.]